MYGIFGHRAPLWRQSGECETVLSNVVLSFHSGSKFDPVPTTNVVSTLGRKDTRKRGHELAGLNGSTLCEIGNRQFCSPQPAVGKKLLELASPRKHRTIV